MSQYQVHTAAIQWRLSFVEWLSEARDLVRDLRQYPTG